MSDPSREDEVEDAMSDAAHPDAARPAVDRDGVDRDAVDRGTVDLDAVERDLAGVEVALARLEEGTYWTDEVTGDRLPDELLAADPTARRAP